ncbi:hypothetical protein [Xanthomonas arboricola]|uniref:hypothetical protein n=1 Tax=Xanthomonas arboricola TaxID=56448 RepID=UPI0025AFF00F|nr:hypothetical protein [Xanthomonas arboricola]
MSASTAGEVAIISQLPAEHGGDLFSARTSSPAPENEKSRQCRLFSCQPALLGGSLPAVY